jgi:hypothetical protein
VTKYAVLGGLLLVLAWGWASVFSWVDPSALCRVHIDVELLEGDRTSVKEAIRLVRREDPVAYRELCRWVDRIQEERECMAGDPQADPRFRGAAVINVTQIDPALRRAKDAAGCYMRGSRVVVLRRARDGENPATLLRERAEALARSAGYARVFWTGTSR